MTSTPTKTARLSVPVTPEVQATFQRLADASGRSMAASLSQWLVDTQQAAELMAQNFERLRASPGEVIARVHLHMASVEDLAEQAMEDAMSRANYEEEVPGVGFSARAAGTERRDGPRRGSMAPPSSNTGGKGTKTGTGKSGGRSAGFGSK